MKNYISPLPRFHPKTDAESCFPQGPLCFCIQFHPSRVGTISFQSPHLEHRLYSKCQREPSPSHLQSSRRLHDLPKVNHQVKLCSWSHDGNTFLTREGLRHLRKRRQPALGQTKVGELEKKKLRDPQGYGQLREGVRLEPWGLPSIPGAFP